MTFEHGGAQADVTVHVPRREVVKMYVGGGVFLALAVTVLTSGHPWFAMYWLALGCVSVTGAQWRRRFAVELTAESARFRGLRWRIVPWAQVQAVVRHRRRGEWVVPLMLDNGKLVTLRDPTTWRSVGDAEHEASFERIEHWWLAHRGQSWRPVRPEAPLPPIRKRD